MFAQGIRLPTVPASTSRIRVTPIATHTRDDLQHAGEAFAATGKEVGGLVMKPPPYAALRAWEHTYVWHPFTQMQDWLDEDPVVIARGEGNYLIDVQGNRYLDAVSSLWCNTPGHTRPELNAAIAEPLDQIAHSPILDLSNIPATLLAKRLVEITPVNLSRGFYSDAGATAVEIALKLTCQYWQLKHQRPKV